MTGHPDAAADRAAAFIHAIVWAEHTILWDLLSDDGRAAALSVAMRNGLDRVVAGRIHDDLADPPEERSPMTDALLVHLRDLASGLDDPASILDAYRDRCSTLGQAVELRLLPHGSMRGLAEDIDDAGGLVPASPTGLRERISVSELNNVTLLPA
ncbi:MAG: hypothetical protein OXC00_08955 [Acidimicrobiaceae bacterium]|nr:hypothetical protein [Acidimicrobiaceae bacterium]